MTKKASSKKEKIDEKTNKTKNMNQKPKGSVKVEKKSAPIKKENKAPKTTEKKKTLDVDKILRQASSKGKFLAPMLASTYDGNQDIKNWIMSEKLDGVRCIWDGKRLMSRNGNEFCPPKFFIEHFPKDCKLDGELFIARKEFAETLSVVLKQTPHDGWNKLKYLIFDGPDLKGNFKSRLEQLKKKTFFFSSPYIALHKHEICPSKEALEKKMDEIIKLDGEGIIIRDPNSHYENKRSTKMLKVKRFHDAEATVIKHEKGTGKNEMVMGALVVKNKDGVVFKVGGGFSDRERERPPKVGAVITYRYFELSKKNVPRFPVFLRVHYDV